MKTRLVRPCLSALVLSAGLVQSAVSATRLCSVYVESFSVLQKQLFTGAEVFQAPQLGALPMMMGAGLPGAAQMNNDKPLALHILNLGENKTGLVVEVTPSGTAEAYLKALAGGAEAALPAPVGGVYTLENGMAAKEAGGRLFFVLKADDPAACLAAGLERLPPMPAMPGAIRVSVAPSAMVPLLDSFKKTMAAAQANPNPAAEQGRQAVSGALDFYGQLFRQVDAYHLSLNIQTEGLFIRSRLAPKAGTDMAALVAGAKPATAAQLAFVEKGSFLSFASGGGAVPERFKRQIADFYVRMLTASPLYATMQTNELASVMGHSIRLLGAPLAVTAGAPGADGTLPVQGFMNVADPAGYLNEQLALMKTPVYQTLMGKSGLTFPEPTKRSAKGLTVYSWKTDFDEVALEKAARAGLPPNLPPEQADAAAKSSVASMREMMKLFSGGYEYAATAQALLFGMGSPALIEAVAERVRAPARPGAEAERIRTVLSPSGAPHNMGRLSLGGLMGLGLAAQPELAAAAKGIPPGEGVIFTGWTVGGEMLGALLVPPSEVKAVTALTQAVQAQALQKAGAPVARPPIPPGF